MIGLGIRIVDDCIVVASPRNGSGDEHDVEWFIPEIRRLRETLAAGAPNAIFVAGGAGFSATPRECLDALDVEFGVVGAGERPVASLVERLRAGRDFAGVRGVVSRTTADPLAHYGTQIEGRTRREASYAAVNSLAVRTRVGCAMECAYCVTANLRRRHQVAPVEQVADEIERLVELARAHNLRRVPIFFADDEVNLPDEQHPIDILRRVHERGLAKRITWRGFFNPVPFGDELAEIVKQTNGHVSITVDSAAHRVLVASRKPFRRRHLERLIETLARHEVSADLGLIFGLPGEDDETIAETVRFVRSLPPEIEVAYSAGARVYPHTPLAAAAAAEPEYVVGSDPTFFAPTAFSRPHRPRELARRLDQMLGDLPNVKPLGASYMLGGASVATAYRVVLGNGSAKEWERALATAESTPDYGRSVAETIGACLQIAIWHDRIDLARPALLRLSQQRALPDGVTRHGLLFARAVAAVVERFGPSSREDG